MPPKKASWQRHKQAWKNCVRCSFCETRKRTILLQGRIPATMLFIVDPPSASDQILGKCITGSAFEVFEYILHIADPHTLKQKEYAITPAFPCRSKDNPKIKNYKECSPRLDNLIKIIRPSLIVCCGKTAKKMFQKVTSYGEKEFPPSIEIPSFIYLDNLSIAEKEFEIQKATIKLIDAVNEYLVPF